MEAHFFFKIVNVPLVIKFLQGRQDKSAMLPLNIILQLYLGSSLELLAQYPVSVNYIFC